LERKKSVNQSYARIMIEGEEKEMSITELKNKIIFLLQYPKEFIKKTNILYRFTVYTPQEEMKQIILESSETRLDTLRHIFGIDKYKRIRENTELFTAKLRESIRNYEGQLKDFEEIKKKLEEKKQNVSILNENIENLKKEVAQKKENRKQVEIALKEVEDKINLNDRIFNQENTIRYLEERLENLDKQVLYSTINVNLREKKSDYADIELVDVSTLTAAFVGSIDTLAVLAVAILPWAVVLWLIVIVWRKLSKPKKAK